jgi:hypothetical protein
MTFAQLVDPIVKEYEQSIESLESELYRLKAAWVSAARSILSLDQAES